MWEKTLQTASLCTIGAAVFVFRQPDMHILDARIDHERRRTLDIWDAVRNRTAAVRRSISPPQLLAGSFALLIGAGTIGFMALPGLYAGSDLSWLDALFTATSAVCVTGLIVVDTATYFTGAGQGYILLLIQLGGLGIITFTSLILIALGMSLSVRQEAVTRSAADIAPHVDFKRLARDVVIFTFVTELVGAVLFFLFWASEFPLEQAAWHSVFHAISAFCNAGFSTFSDSLIQYQTHSGILVVVMALIVLGGIGFLVLEELYLKARRQRWKGRTIRLSLHSRLVLAGTVVLLVGGWLLFGFFEWNVGFSDMAAVDRVWNALFMSVTARTAGFNTVDYTFVTDGSNFLTILLMSIGGSPGSTAGGLKTTTVAVIGVLAFSRMRGYRIASIWGRSIPEEVVQRAVGLFVVGFGIVTVAIFLFTLSEITWLPHARLEASFLKYMFEAVSAFNTVGLTMGATDELSDTGKALAIALMYLGRVGPLTFAAALARRHARGASFYYAYEDVAIG